MNLLQRAGKNIFWLFISEVCMRGIMFVAILYLARTLGASGFGLYSLGVTTGIVLWGIADDEMDIIHKTKYRKTI